MDLINSRTAFYKHMQGLFTSLVLSSVIALCTSTPIPPQEQLHPRVHYERLVRDTDTLHLTHQMVYSQFKSVRFDDPAIRVDDFSIAGIPRLDTLPTPSERLSMLEEVLLPIHYRRIKAFKEVLGFAIQDESTLMLTGDENFTERLRNCRLLTDRVESKLRQTMQRLEIDLDYDWRPSVNFTISQSDSILNLRILFVLQELNEYLVPVLQDFVNYKSKHDRSSS